MKKLTSWREKLADSKDLPRVVRITPRMSPRWGKGTVVIPAPLEVDRLMRRVPVGKLTTINEIRVALAREHRATIGCPITTGIFAWIAANAAAESLAAGRKAVTPYWRTLKAGGQLNEKYPGGLAGSIKRLRAEGHKILTRGKKRFVADFQHKLITFSTPHRQ